VKPTKRGGGSPIKRNGSKNGNKSGISRDYNCTTLVLLF
jgi:hypothetical protein